MLKKLKIEDKELARFKKESSFVKKEIKNVKSDL
jgi:hypothetical protein